jgi:hypothetical protein
MGRDRNSTFRAGCRVDHFHVLRLMLSCLGHSMYCSHPAVRCVFEQVPCPCRGAEIQQCSWHLTNAALAYRQAVSALGYLAAIEFAWQGSHQAVSVLPKPLGRLVTAIFKPAKTCVGYARWAAWLSFLYLSMREVQSHCKASDSDSILVPPPSDEERAPFVASSSAAGLPSRSPEGTGVASSEMGVQPDKVLPRAEEGGLGAHGRIMGLLPGCSGDAAVSAWQTVRGWMDANGKG